MLVEANNSGEQHALNMGFKRVVSRLPKPTELASLTVALQELGKHTQLDSANAEEADLSKWTAMGSILLNLDDALTR